jgi:transcriptional regulator EpsA
MANTLLHAPSRHTTPDGAATRSAPDGLFAVIRQSLRIERHYDLYQWLQGDLQRFLPHHILIAAWGDFWNGSIHYDVISALPGVRTTHLGSCDIAPVASLLFQEWLKRGCLPFSNDYPIGMAVNATRPGPSEAEMLYALRNMGSSLVHGIKDRRGSHDCLYIALNIELGISSAHQGMFEFLLPFIDTALRRVALLPGETAAHTEARSSAEAPASLPETILSSREIEIMNWVSKGKTNLEIGTILDISSFTVKNHLQRIFRKLNVSNRAQAVALYEALSSRLPST